jgi:archaemetzincin
MISLSRHVTTPVHVLLVLTPEGARTFERSSKGERGLRFGIGRGQIEKALRELEARGLAPSGPEVMVLDERMLHKGRGQYNSSYLLGLARERAKRMTDWHTKVLVITDADMYATGSKFVVGQAELDGRSAVVSLTRIRAGDEARFLRRLVTETLHELGHTLGLRHCRDKDCVMFSSKILPESDIKSHEFCERCRVKVGRALGP